MEKELLNYLAEHDCLIADGFDNAIIGTTYNKEAEMIVVYDIEKCIESLVKDGMNDEDAIEFFYYNTMNCYVGAKSPLFINTL